VGWQAGRHLIACFWLHIRHCQRHRCWGATNCSSGMDIAATDQFDAAMKACPPAVCSARSYDFFQGQESTLGSHEAGVKCVEWLPAQGLVVSGGWDRCGQLTPERCERQQNCKAGTDLHHSKVVRLT
jgi:hypothetical protein